MGMIPYSFTVTSHIVITLGLAIMAFLAINIIGIKTHGFHMLSLFLPSGAPIALAPLLVMIEIVSYSFRVVSLALRLFANMMSGHCLLKILAGFA
jgi:F-type H+-transporting ATPase subunit a